MQNANLELIKTTPDFYMNFHLILQITKANHIYTLETSNNHF